MTWLDELARLDAVARDESVDWAIVRVHASLEAGKLASSHVPDILAMRDALRAGHEQGWLIEEDYGYGCHWITLAKDSWPRWKTSTRRSRRDSNLDVETIEYLTPVHRVKDANDALRFARKQDAEAFIALFERYLLHAKATEHEFVEPRQALGEKP